MWIYTPYMTRKGKRIYASDYGLKAFRFWFDKDKIKKKSKKHKNMIVLDKSC